MTDAIGPAIRETGCMYEAVASPRPRRVVRASALTTAAIALLVSAGAADTAGAAGQQLLSVSASGGVPNADVSTPVISRDARSASRGAYVSAATDIVAGTDGHRNVFLVTRQPGHGLLGDPWVHGSTTLVTRGRDGAPANGDSWSPSLDGSSNNDTPIAPKCLAFVSEASNLVAGDTNGKADVFLLRLKTSKLERIDTKGPATEVAVSGTCEQIAWASGGRLYVWADGKTVRMQAKRVRSAANPTDISITEERKKSFSVVFAQKGSIKTSRKGQPARRVARGNRPSPDQYARYVAYDREGVLLQANLTGAPKERRAVRAPGSSGQGTYASSTAGGQHVFYALGSSVFRNVTKKAEGTCPSGHARETYAGARGNYVVFTCSGGGPAYLHYVGAK